MKKTIPLVALLLLVMPMVFAANYTVTGRTDFDLFSDQEADLDGFVYSTVRINQSFYSGEEFKCITMLFANESGVLLHVQSNPPHVNPMRLGLINPNSRMTTSPEALGYFQVNNGIANVYYRSKDVVAYNEFLYVVMCNSNNTSLVYEESLNPNYKEFGKDLPSRGVWLAKSENAEKLVFVVAVVFIILMFIYFRLLKGR